MILKPTDENILRAAKDLKDGKLVTFPTETVYGLGANGLNDTAVNSIYEAKGRPANNPLILHLYTPAQVAEVAEFSSSGQKKLFEKLTSFWPGALSIVLPKKASISNAVTAGLDTVAIRIPNHPVALKLLKAADIPVAAPSANPYNYISPTTAEHVENGLGEKAGIILDGGPCQIGLESTVLTLTTAIPAILRPGGVTLEDLQKVIGKVKLKKSETAKPLSPGMSKIHYSPSKKVFFSDQAQKIEIDNKTGILSFRAQSNLTDTNNGHMIVLSQNGSYKEIAAKLFSAMQEMDNNQQIETILIDSCPEQGLGTAIMDRLKRACAK